MLYHHATALVAVLTIWLVQLGPPQLSILTSGASIGITGTLSGLFGVDTLSGM